MKKIVSTAFIAASAFAIFSAFSCKGEQKTEDIIVDRIVEKPQDGPERMAETQQGDTVTWIGGAIYNYSTTRQAKDSLGIVENNGKQYYNNAIKLVVSRNDGSVFFQKTFTKANFAPAMPKRFNDTGVLLGINLEKAQGNELRFVVNIGSPDESNEEFVYVLMTLDNFGNTKAQEYKVAEAAN